MGRNVPLMLMDQEKSKLIFKGRNLKNDYLNLPDKTNLKDVATREGREWYAADSSNRILVYDIRAGS